MKRARQLIAIAAVAAAFGSGVVGATQRAVQISIPLPGFEMLNAIDSVPARVQVERAFGDNALAELRRIATTALDTVDAGVQVRAIRALVLFPEGRTTVLDVLARSEIATARAGTGVVVQRTAVEALGSYRKAEDVELVVTYLNAEYSRDVRVSAARALGQIGAQTAVEPLRTRFRSEQTAQVKVEISTALHALGQ